MKYSLTHQPEEQNLSKIEAYSIYCLFLTAYIFLYYLMSCQQLAVPQLYALESLPLFCACITLLYSISITHIGRSYQEKIIALCSSMLTLHTLYDYITLISIILFNYYVAQTNGTLTCITLAVVYLSSYAMMTSMFALAALYAMCIQNISTALITLVPIGYGIAQSLQANSAFMLATLIGGVLCGQHISMLYKNFYKSQTTFKNYIQQHQSLISIMVIATIANFIICLQYQCPPLSSNIMQTLQTSLHLQNFITVIPYALVCLTRYYEIDLIISLWISITCAIIIKIVMYQTAPLSVALTLFHGLYSNQLITQLLMLHLMLAGLYKITSPYNQSCHSLGQLIFKSMPTTHDTTHAFAHSSLQTFLPYGCCMMIVLHISKIDYMQLMTYALYPLLFMSMHIALYLYQKRS